MTRTAEDFSRQSILLNITEWMFRRCSICNMKIGYRFDSGRVRFHPGCGCSDNGDSDPRTWEDVANQYNMQDAPAVIAEMDKHWRWEETSTPSGQSPTATHEEARAAVRQAIEDAYHEGFVAGRKSDTHRWAEYWAASIAKGYCP